MAALAVTALVAVGCVDVTEDEEDLADALAAELGSDLVELDIDWPALQQEREKVREEREEWLAEREAAGESDEDDSVIAEVERTSDSAVDALSDALAEAVAEFAPDGVERVDGEMGQTLVAADQEYAALAVEVLIVPSGEEASDPFCATLTAGSSGDAAGTPAVESPDEGCESLTPTDRDFEFRDVTRHPLPVDAGADR